ncbi:PAS domain S-box-containing protein/diguanylate cyclase (GGDEF) domain-containing protein [Abditibacterium utsteinense]|uniref:PAS domain S-box-containing protein/diguanylate cyclase (GGDEF) domain-containing protein n=1 Tax=Abditibacterium utsteinense TaxID=1960156 RepID=A0A2S8SQS7_9BACT|nr:EAL domain-containing protein [Abditibacterium utsteinense]PQV63162.1 PAS domain S-box-containing protein/diguanylate cyclase (GGDEF) domain-containing protein [Abditibacterium utsteinense]
MSIETFSSGSAQVPAHEIQFHLEKCEAVLRAISRATKHFSVADWPDQLDAILGELGVATDVSRIYLFENSAADQKLFSMVSVWAAPQVARDVLPKNGKWSIAEWQSWQEILSSGAAATKNEGVSEEEREANEFPSARDAFSTLAVPIEVAGEFWGGIGFHECRARRPWTQTDLATLHVLSALIGSAIERTRSHLAIRLAQSDATSELQALLSTINDAIFVLDSAGRYRKIVANDPTLLFRPDAELIGRSIDEVIGGEQGQQLCDVVRDVLTTSSPRRLEYSLSIDGKINWFFACVTPLSPDTVLWVARDMTQAHQTRESLRESEALFRLLAENSTDKIARMSVDGTFLYVSPSVKSLLGYEPKELVGTVPFDMIYPEDQHIVMQSFEKIMNSPGLTDLIIYRMRHRNGNYVWFETTSRMARDAEGQNLEIHAVSRDISARRATEDALREAEAKYRSIFENAVEGIFQTTPSGHYLDANPSLAHIYGYESPAHLKESLTDISGQLYLDARRRQNFVDEMAKNGAVSNFEAEVKRRDGEIIWISENARAVRNEAGDLLYYEGTVEDITARKSAEDQLVHNALHDKLTGLSNRTLFMDRLVQAFGRLKRHPQEVFAVLFLDFDRFKNINDSLGHMAGDQLLVSISQRLSDCLRPDDTVSRLGGDEFSILLQDVGDVAGAILVAQRVQNAVSQPFAIAGQEVFTSTSIGIALGHLEYDNPEDLLRDADMAMYRAKATGKARHEVFDAGMHKRAVALLQLETDLRWAIEREEFQLWYQPIVNLETGRIGGFEALIRWNHPTRGLVPPLDFIPIAEETGWIVPIGRWVLEEACRQLAQWHSEDKNGISLSISVNLSAKQFSQPDLIAMVEDVLKRHHLPPGCLKLEITESAIMENVQDVTDRLLRLHSLGVKLGLDDFGTGYSSLSYLHRFQLDTLKIDRSFITRMNEGGENREIVRTIVSLGKNLGMDVVAEGVEDAQQLADLRALQCNNGQGYFFARPLTSLDAFAMLQNAPVW